ncbi:MAG: DUF2804 domain-containing protein [Clostridiales bacterium]|nr:DUF2804 domain-containing protein [Roseburia sp.]MDD7635927.1 DUF2804 domain-containing protein [Clostridiales bacterium]MDY4114166.1 DUF2804 domain-containing protein [Roseburia sp.]
MGERNHEVTREQKLLNAQGNIAECGWSRRQLQVYERGAIRAPKFRIKEWDYYMVLNQDFAAAFTISDDGYVGLQSVSFLDFTRPWEHTETILDAFPMGKLHLPKNSSTGNTVYESKRLNMRFLVEKESRRIVCEFKNFNGDKDFACDIRLRQPDMDTMVIATPWTKKHAFYYNQKINCMRAEGWVQYDGKKYEFHPDTDFGTLDWGRGVWTYDNTWYWGSGNCDIDGKAFGFNIGYGFGDTSAATENVIFYDGKVHKLEDVTFHIPKDDYCKSWTFTSSDGRFEMDFEPVIDRAANLDFKLIVSDQHQVFGRMSGTAILDDGTPIQIKDVMCFAEKVHNRY